MESFATEGVCNELTYSIEVHSDSVMSEDGLKVGRNENAIERAIDKDLLELIADPRVNFGGAAPRSVV